MTSNSPAMPDRLVVRVVRVRVGPIRAVVVVVDRAGRAADLDRALVEVPLERADAARPQRLLPERRLVDAAPRPVRRVAVGAAEVGARGVERRRDHVRRRLDPARRRRVVPPLRARVVEEPDHRLPRRAAADVLAGQVAQLVVEQAAEQPVLEGADTRPRRARPASARPSQARSRSRIASPSGVAGVDAAEVRQDAVGAARSGCRSGSLARSSSVSPPSPPPRSAR